MRIAVLSDVHGNCLALETVVEDLTRAGCDRIVCNGDMIQGGPQPHETVVLLRQLDCPVVMGNSDAWLLTGVETEVHPLSEERRQRLDLGRVWSLGQLGEADRAFIAAFQPTVAVDLGGGRELLAFHGSPTSFDQVLLPSTPEDEFQEALKPQAAKFLTGGHVHLQYLRRLRDNPTFYFNPGSVGLAYNHAQSGGEGRIDPWAEYAILSVDGFQVQLEFRRRPLDMEKLAEVYRKSDQPFADTAMEKYVRY